MSLYEKWVKLVDEVGYVQKRGVNTYHNYSYVTEEDLLDALRPRMADLGLVFFPSSAEVIDNKGSVITIKYTYTLVDADTGESVDIQVIAQGADSQDKGAYKAATGARKYALRQLVLVSTGDDPERDTDSLESVAKNKHAVVTARKLKDAGIRYDSKELEDAIGMRFVDIPNTNEGTEVMKKLYTMAAAVSRGGDRAEALAQLKKELNSE